MIVVVLFGVYRLAVVPYVEPSIDPLLRRQVSEQTLQVARQKSARQFAYMAELFPKGSWELDNPIILNSDQVQLLIGKYEPCKGNRNQVSLKPCTIIFTPDGPPETLAERRRQSIIMQSEKEALLNFDQPFDLRRLQVGKVVGGRLMGKITIRSRGKTDRADDDLWIETRDAQLDEQKIWTPHPVQFRMGPHRGRGRDLHIRLASDDPLNPQVGLLGRGGKKKKRKSTDSELGGIEMFELRQLDFLELLMSDKAIGSVAGSTPPVTSGDPSKQNKMVPVRITCQRGFQLNLSQQWALFQDDVRVERFYPQAPSDLLLCDKLTIELESQKVPKNEASKETTEKLSEKTVPRKLIAEGRPVRVRSIVEKFEAEGARLELDLIEKKVSLENPDTKPVRLQYDGNEILAPNLQYGASPKPGRVGQIVAAGPGWIHGKIGKNQDQPFRAQWQRELRLQPHQQNQVLSLTGGVFLEAKPTGSLSAGEIHLYLNEVASVSPQTGKETVTLEPDRMQADGEVSLESDQVSAKVNELQLWFKKTPAPANSASTSDLAGHSPQPPSHQPNNRGPSPLDRPKKKPDNHYSLTARLLQAEAVLQDRKARLVKLILLDEVELIETKTKNPDDRPIVMRGEEIHVIDAVEPHAAATITGNPARFEGRGLTLTSSNINLNRGTNLLKVDGPGTMVLPPMKRDLQGQSVAAPQPIQIDWQKQMEFDGRTVEFQHQVVAQTALQRLTTETMRISLNQMVRFDEKKPGERFNRGQSALDVQELLCLGGVRLENQTIEAGLLVSKEDIHVRQMVFNQLSGKMTAQGPGSIRSVRLGGLTLPGADTTKPNRASHATNPTASGPQMTYLHVRFAGNAIGHLSNRTIRFANEVRLTFGPVTDWGATLPDDNPDALGPSGAVMSCQAMTITEMGSLTNGKPAMELQASDNVVIEGLDFTARGSKISYQQQKGLLTLQGDGRSPASLCRQAQVGGSQENVAAKKIQYWLQGGQIQVNGAQSLEVNQSPFGTESRR